MVQLLLSGCVHPDRWGIFEHSLDRKMKKEAERSFEIPETPEPRLEEEPAFALPPEGPLELSVEQAIMLALRNNRDLHVRQIGPIIAGTFEQIERGVYDPELFIDYQYFEEKATEISRSTGSQYNVDGSETTAAAGIRQELPTGTTFELAAEHDYSESDRTPEQYGARVGLSITQSLLRGFGPAANLARVRQARLESVASVYELRGFTEALLAETETAYWNYILANKEIEIFERSLDVAQRQLEEVELRIEVGIYPEIEAAAARAEVARREQALIDARSLLEERRLRLLKLINPHPDGWSDILITATSKPDFEPQPITDMQDRLELALRLRPDLNEAHVRLDQNLLETIMTRNGLLPKLDLFVALGQTGYADSFSKSFDALDGETYDFTVGVRLNHFIGNRAAEARYLAARASRRQAEEAVANLEQIVKLDVMLAINEVERSRQQIVATRATRILEEETVKAEKERFDVGRSTALLVSQAQRDLLVSSIAEVRAIVNYRIALIGLYRAEGSLLERRGVSFPAGPVTESGPQPKEKDAESGLTSIKEKNTAHNNR
jgi:outer membrane protein